jgi:DNA-binding NarL/FixJ family response regulator
MTPAAVHLRGALSSRPTDREIAVLRACLANGSRKGAAHELGIAPATVRNHLTHLYAVLGVVMMAQAVAWLDDHEPGWRAA